MKVAVLPTIREWPWGAPGACMGALVEKLLTEGHHVLWLVAPIDLEHPDVSRLAMLGARLVPLPEPAKHYLRLPTFRRRVDAVFAGRATLRRILTDFSPEHIFVNQGGAWSALGDESLLECLHHWRGRYSLIIHLNQPGYPFSPTKFLKARRLVADAKRIFFNSRWVRRLTELQICKEIQNAEFYQLPLRFQHTQPLPWPDSHLPRLTMVNRLDAYHKGIDVALCAIARLSSEGMEVELGIYGKGPDEEYLRELIEFLRLRDKVALHGHRDDIDNVWKSEELLLLPSRFEGCSVSMLEAMSFGRPVLQTPHGGADEWIEDGINGYICPAVDEHVLYQTLVRALSDRAHWRERGLRAHEKIIQCLSTDPGKTFLTALQS